MKLDTRLLIPNVDKLTISQNLILEQNWRFIEHYHIDIVSCSWPIPELQASLFEKCLIPTRMSEAFIQQSWDANTLLRNICQLEKRDRHLNGRAGTGLPIEGSAWSEIPTHVSYLSTTTTGVCERGERRALHSYLDSGP